MGLEKEKLESSIIMDEDEFSRSIEPILSKKAGLYPSAPDRDPRDIHAHLKVTLRNCSSKVKTARCQLAARTICVHHLT